MNKSKRRKKTMRKLKTIKKELLEGGSMNTKSNKQRKQMLCVQPLVV